MSKTGKCFFHPSPRKGIHTSYFFLLQAAIQEIWGVLHHHCTIVECILSQIIFSWLLASECYCWGCLGTMIFRVLVPHLIIGVLRLHERVVDRSDQSATVVVHNCWPVSHSKRTYICRPKLLCLRWEHFRTHFSISLQLPYLQSRKTANTFLEIVHP